jgi:predicted esterase YcpF (UPF0227 family)
MLKKYETAISDQSKIMLMVQKGDDVLDYCEAVNKLHHAKQIVEEGGDHSFVGVEKYFDEMSIFLE